MILVTVSITGMHGEMQSIRSDKSLKEIVLIDKWCNYGANKGL